MIKLALYQPDIPQNVGAAIRLCACLGIELDIIEPAGFPWDARKIRQSAMDYYDAIEITRHKSWSDFKSSYKNGRVILMTTKGAVPYTGFNFEDGDILLAGQESCGVPEEIHSAVDARVYIPMMDGLRSLNIVNATAMILGEAVRQLSFV